MTKKTSVVPRQSPSIVSGGRRKRLEANARHNRLLTLLRLLTETDRPAQLLPSLHEHAVTSVGGSCSILFQRQSRTTRFRAISCYGLDQPPTDEWPQSAAEHGLLELMLKEERPRQFGGDHLPHLKAMLRTDSIVIAPMVQWREPVGLLAIGTHEGPFPIESTE